MSEHARGAFFLVAKATLPVFGYLLLSALFTSMSAQAGLLVPFGPPKIGVLVLGLVVLVVRLYLFFIAPFVLAYRLARHFGQPVRP